MIHNAELDKFFGVIRYHSFNSNNALVKLALIIPTFFFNIKNYSVQSDCGLRLSKLVPQRPHVLSRNYLSPFLRVSFMIFEKLTDLSVFLMRSA